MKNDKLKQLANAKNKMEQALTERTTTKSTELLKKSGNQRPLLTKTDSVSILIKEAEQLTQLKNTLTNPTVNFYVSKSDLYRVGLKLLFQLNKEEITNLVKEVKL